MKLKSIVAVAFATLSALAGNVQASPIWTVSLHGSIFAGTDYSGVFGTVGQDLTGLEYTQTVAVSVDPTQYTLNNTTAYSDYRFTGTAPFSVLATVTVNSRTVTFNILHPDYAEQFIADGVSSGGVGPDEIYSYNTGFDSAGTSYVVAYTRTNTNVPGSGFVPTLDFGQTINATIGSNFNANTIFSVNGVNHTFFNALAPVSITVNVGDPSADVPEPASSALFGFGLLAVIAFRRRCSSDRGK